MAGRMAASIPLDLSDKRRLATEAAALTAAHIRMEPAGRTLHNSTGAAHRPVHTQKARGAPQAAHKLALQRRAAGERPLRTGQTGRQPQAQKTAALMIHCCFRECRETAPNRFPDFHRFSQRPTAQTMADRTSA